MITDNFAWGSIILKEMGLKKTKPKPAHFLKHPLNKETLKQPIGSKLSTIKNLNRIPHSESPHFFAVALVLNAQRSS